MGSEMCIRDSNSISLCDSDCTSNSPIQATANTVTYDRSSQLQTLRTLLKCYKEQTELNRSISENIGTVSTLEQTVYYACIWTHQPAIGEGCFIAERQLAFMLQM